MTKDTITRINQDGLRYTSKVSGSPFSGRGQTRSCFKCGQHRSADQLQGQRILGKVQMVCKPSCKALAQPVASVEAVALDTVDPAVE